MAAQDYAALAQTLYVTYFGRPGDYFGMQSFQAQLDAMKAPTDLATLSKLTQADKAGTTALSKLVNSFNTSKEATDMYGTDTSPLGVSKFVEAIYLHVLNRAPDAAGWKFWVDAISSGTLPRATAAAAIADGAANNTTAQGLLDAKTVSNKIAVATDYTNSLVTVAQINGYAGNDAAAAARAMLESVNSATNVADYHATVVTTLDAVVGASIPSQTFNLTQAVDTVTGTGGNDVFVAGPTILAADGMTVINSLQSVDNLNGGAGTDTLKVTIGAAGNVKPILASIEKVQVAFNQTGAASLDLSAATGVNTVTVSNSTTAGAITGVGAAGVAIANQTAAVTFDGLTADAISLNVNTVGTAAAYAQVDLGAVSASKATSEALTLNNAYINLADTVANTGIKSASIAAAGKTGVKFTNAAATLETLTVTGAGSVDASGVALTALKTLTAADGGVKVNATGGILKTVTTGAGNDTITAVGATVGVFATGAGNDKVSAVTTALVATSSIDLGDGNDTLTLGVASTAGATLTGGAGTDTLAMAVADYNTISGSAAANLAKITGFEVLSITGAALATGTTVDLGAIAGLTSLATLGVAHLGAATVTNVGANAAIILNGDTNTNDGALTVTLKDATGTSDVLNVTINQDVTDNGDGLVTAVNGGATIVAAGVETINVKSTSTLLNAGALDDLDIANNHLLLTDAALVNLNVTGGSQFAYVAASGNTKLASIDASANTGGANVDASGIVGGVAVTIKGAATAANTLTGSVLNDTIIGGAKSDIITGGAGGDTLTGNGGNDKFVIAAGDSTIAAGNADTITDFVANTYGFGTNGLVTSVGANGVAANKLTGDVIQVTKGAGVATAAITVGVYTNAADATTFLQTQSATEGAVAGSTTVHAALNSTTGDLYIDVDGNGTADVYLHLTGVTTLTAAAFTIL